jgi:SpoVK/Ycf46/Vps4 family AAA+-type ATPase
MHESEFLFDEPSSPPIAAKDEKELLGPRHLSASQAAALRRLSDLAQLRGQEERAGVRVRHKPLIVGASGVGKTAVVRRLCDVEGLPLLVINAGSWNVHGAATGPHTLAVIRQFVETHPEGCVFVDELDKSCPGRQTFSSNWALGALTEVICFLDSDLKLQTSGWRPEHISRLRDAYFVVGAGAWQCHVKAEKEISGHGYIDRIRTDAGIPDEIILRFSPRLIAISGPTEKDLSTALRRIRSDLSLPSLATEVEQKLVSEAVASGYGMRWLEDYLTQLMIQHPQPRKKKQSAAKPDREKITITRQEFGQRLAAMLEQLDGVRKPAKELEVKLRLALVIAVQSTPDQRKNFLEPRELSSLIEEIQGLLPALAYGMSTTEQERTRREAQVHMHGRHLLSTLDDWFKAKPFAMKSCGLLDLAIQLHVSLRRVLDAWSYLGKVGVTE